METGRESVMISFHAYMSHRKLLVLIEKALFDSLEIPLLNVRLNSKYHSLLIRRQGDSLLYIKYNQVQASSFNFSPVGEVISYTSGTHESYTPACCAWRPLEYLFAPCLTSGKISPCRSLHAVKQLTADLIALPLVSLSFSLESCCALLSQYESLLWKRPQMAQKQFYNFYVHGRGSEWRSPIHFADAFARHDWLDTKLVTLHSLHPISALHLISQLTCSY